MCAQLADSGINTIGHTKPSILAAAAHVATAKRLHGTGYDPLMHGDHSFPYALGDVQMDEAEVRKYRVTLQQTSGTSAADYTPFTGAAAACLSNFPARNQGSCGSCYSFAATSAFSLKYCLEVYRRGYSHADTTVPVLTVQNMVSCGQGYNNGCSGGSGYSSYMYIREIGITTVACLPYMSGGGDPLNHFEARPRRASNAVNA